MDFHRPRNPTASVYLWLAHALLLLTVYGSLIPLRFQPVPLDEALARFRHMHRYDPKLTEARGDWAVNMVQYAAVSFCYVAALAVDRRQTRGLWAAAVIVPAGWAVALATEFLQVYFPPRTVSVNDVLVECLGTVLGAAAWLLAGQRCTDWWRRFWGGRGLSALAAQALPAYLAVLLVVHLLPFDVILGRKELADKFQQGRILLVPFFSGLASEGIRGVIKWVTNFAAFLPVGVLLGLLPRWSRMSARAILGVGLGLTASVEFLQLLIYTRFCDVTDILTGTGAIFLGWYVARGLQDPRPVGGLPGRVRVACGAVFRRASRWGPSEWTRLALGWALILVLANWQPFDFTTDPARFVAADPDQTDEDTSVFGIRRMSWAPLVDYYWGSRYEALNQFLWRSASFAPLGILLAQAFGSRQRRGELLTVVAALALSAVIEIGQYFIPERHPSVTDLLIETLGAWLGYHLARHAAHVLGSDLSRNPSWKSSW
jgi:glycopeptide antibiotics resistance protein